MAESAILFSHIIPPIMAVISVIFICTGVMDKKNIYTLLGIILFFAAGIIPFLILPYMLN